MPIRHTFKFIPVAVATLALASAAQAQQMFSVDVRNQTPFILGIGGYFPTINGTTSSFSGGPEVVAGVRFAGQGFDVVGSARGKAFFSSDSNGAGGRFQVGVISFDLFLRANSFYAGPGVGTASSTASITFYGDGSTTDNLGTAAWQTVWSLTAGCDVASNAFIEARWQNSDIQAYKGYSVMMGLRF